jgi:hypothetical protein
MFLESPVPILVVGTVVEAVLAIALLRTGRGVLLIAMLGVALVVAAGVLVERFTVTERKLVIRTIDEAAAAVEANDLERALKCVSTAPDADAVRSEAHYIHRIIEITQLRIRGLDVTVNKTGAVPMATARFMAIVTGRAKSREFADFGEPTHVAEVTLKLRFESGRWLIVEFDRDRRGEP